MLGPRVPCCTPSVETIGPTALAPETPQGDGWDGNGDAAPGIQPASFLAGLRESGAMPRGHRHACRGTTSNPCHAPHPGQGSTSLLPGSMFASRAPTLSTMGLSSLPPGPLLWAALGAPAPMLRSSRREWRGALAVAAPR